jgi:hypothetical protein
MRSGPSRWRALVAVVALSAGGPGCFAVADLDRFHAAPADGGAGGSSPRAPTYEGLTFHLSGMKPHETQLFEYRVVDANNMVQSHGIVDPWPGDEISLVAPRAVPPQNGPYRLDFYMDMNGSRSYDGIGNVTTQDHAWRIDPLADYPAGQAEHVEGAVAVDFVHNLSFTDIDKFRGSFNPPSNTGTNASIECRHLTAYAGKSLQVRIADSATGHVVGLYRHTAIPADDFTLVVPGVIDGGADYNVDVYLDANANGAYDNPSAAGGDLGWRLLKRTSSVEEGLRVTFDPDLETNDTVDVGPP